MKDAMSVVSMAVQLAVGRVAMTVELLVGKMGYLTVEKKGKP